jgi:hypothetical protein
VDTQYPSKILNGFYDVHNCVAWKTLQTFLLSDQLDESEHSKFLVFQYGSWSSLLSPQERISQEQHLSQSERQNNDFSNRQSTLHLFFEDAAWCHTITSTWIWVQNSGTKFHVPQHSDTKLSTPVAVTAKNQGQLVF